MPDNIARLRYQCRRGMLELDALLQPFFEHHYLSLSPEQQAAFERLLTASDQDLFAWLIGRQQPTDPQLITIIQTIKARLG